MAHIDSFIICYPYDNKTIIVIAKYIILISA